MQVTLKPNQAMLPPAPEGARAFYVTCPDVPAGTTIAISAFGVRTATETQPLASEFGHLISPQYRHTEASRNDPLPDERVRACACADAAVPQAMCVLVVPEGVVPGAQFLAYLPVPSEGIPPSGPPDRWYYIDPHGAKQGPHTCAEMKGWASYFPVDMQVLAPGSGEWKALGDVAELQ